MTKNTRDDSLDILKGLACLVMVIAHQPYFAQTSDIALGLINHIAGVIPPTVFFSIAGVTAAIQATRYTLSSLTYYFCAMFLIGLTWNIAVHGDITAFYWPEIFQVIAFGSLCVCIVERRGPAPQWLLLSITVAIVLVKLIVERLWPQFDGWNFLFCDTNYIPEIDSAPNTPVLPGFPLFPWIAYFFLGLWCYRLNKRLKLMMAIACLIATTISVNLGSSVVEKWDSSIAHIFTDFTLVFASLWLFDGYSIANSAGAEQLRKIGSNAFLFFFAHPFGLIGGVTVYLATHNAYAAWLVSIAVSIFIYHLFGKLKPSKRFESRSAWIIMIASTLLIPLLPLLIKHESMALVTRLLAVLIGTLAAVNFSSLTKLTKVKK